MDAIGYDLGLNAERLDRFVNFGPKHGLLCHATDAGKERDDHGIKFESWDEVDFYSVHFVLLVCLEIRMPDHYCCGNIYFHLFLLF